MASIVSGVVRPFFLGLGADADNSAEGSQPATVPANDTTNDTCPTTQFLLHWADPRINGRSQRLYQAALSLILSVEPDTNPVIRFADFKVPTALGTADFEVECFGKSAFVKIISPLPSADVPAALFRREGVIHFIRETELWLSPLFVATGTLVLFKVMAGNFSE
jgi:hypothetical protein